MGQMGPHRLLSASHVAMAQANMASHHIDELRNILEMINERPPFLTMSQDAIDQLGRKLTAMQLSYAHIQEKLSTLPATGIMTFSTDQKAALAAPLSRSNVKERSQSGRTFSYIEGWKAIEEANRIFGFDGWQRETLETRCVADKTREIGDRKAQGFSVSYIARVRVTVGQIVRDGIGAGHGIGTDLGQAHESAIKEAETDAMKRALMTFGNQFGLALYDKQQTNVEDDAPVKHVEPLTKANAKDLYKELETEIRACESLGNLKTWAALPENKKRRAELPADWRQNIDVEYGDKLATFQ